VIAEEFCVIVPFVVVAVTVKLERGVISPIAPVKVTVPAPAVIENVSAPSRVLLNVALKLAPLGVRVEAPVRTTG